MLACRYPNPGSEKAGHAGMAVEAPLAQATRKATICFILWACDECQFLSESWASLTGRSGLQPIPRFPTSPGVMGLRANLQAACVKLPMLHCSWRADELGIASLSFKTGQVWFTKQVPRREKFTAIRHHAIDTRSCVVLRCRQR